MRQRWVELKQRFDEQFLAPPRVVAHRADHHVFAELCKMGLALTWPIALTGLAIFVTLLMR